MKMDIAQEKARLNKLLLKSEDLRNFVNSHEVMIQQTFDQIFADVRGNKRRAEQLAKAKQAPDAAVLSKQNKSNKSLGSKKDSITNVKEAYLKWLMSLYDIEFEQRKQQIQSKVEECYSN